MTNSYKEYTQPNYNNTTSVRKTALSLIGRVYENNLYEKDIDMDLSAIDTPHHPQKRVEQAAANEGDQSANIKKLEEKINILNQKLEQNNNTLYQLESYIIDLKNDQKTEYNTGQYNTYPLYDILKDWLLKRMIMHINGSCIEGVLTEIRPDYVKLVEAEHIVVTPLSRIDLIKLPL